jgi:hypothetical protein
MPIYTYEEAYQHFAQLLEEAKNTTVMAKNLKGEILQFNLFHLFQNQQSLI